MAQMKKPTGKVRKTQAQIDAELAASKKAFEKYKATRPSKAKLAEIYTEQQNRLRRSKTVAPKPVTARPGTAKPAPLGTPPAKPKTTTKAPAKTKMTPQDAAMKKILEKKYGKIYG